MLCNYVCVHLTSDSTFVQVKRNVNSDIWLSIGENLMIGDMSDGVIIESMHELTNAFGAV